MHEVCDISAEEKEESRYKLSGLGCPEGNPGPDCLAYVFVFFGNVIICRLYKLALSEEAQDNLQVRAVLSDVL